MKKLASNTKTAVILFVTFNIFSFVPLFIVSLISSVLASDIWIYILINSILVMPIPYYSLKWAAKSVSRSYVIKENEIVVSLVNKYLIVINSIFFAGNYLFVGYVTASMIVGVFTIGWAYFVIQKYGLSFVPNSPENEVSSSFEDNVSIGSSMGKAALFGIAIFAIFFLVPLMGLIMYGDSLGDMLGYVAILYFTIMLIVGVFVYKKLFQRG